jgi:hypothetical protein
MPFLPGSREIVGYFSPPLLSPLEKQDAQPVFCQRCVVADDHEKMAEAGALTKACSGTRLRLTTTPHLEAPFFPDEA